MNNIKYNFRKSLMRLLFFLSMACSKTDDYTSIEEMTPESLSLSPNILLVITDDMGVDATPGYGLGTVQPHMPNLMQLQASGLTYNNVWSAPMCAPTRASIITGKYGINSGVLNTTNAGNITETETTIQAYLDQQLGNLYASALIGKWHLSNNEHNRPNEMGIDHYAGFIPGTLKDYNQWELTIDGQTTTSEEYITRQLTDLAIKWLNEQEKPWFCWLAYTAPHSPFHLPPAEMHSQGNLVDDPASVEANPRPYYMAMIESIDYEIGRLLSQIPTVERENTVVIFVGDNGTPGSVIQTPFLSNRSKGSLYQGGINVPLIVSGHGVSRKGQRDNSLVHTTDLFATIAQIAGMDNPQYLDSQSFYTTFSEAAPGPRNYNYSEILDFQKPAKSGYTIRNQRYKLIVLDNGSTRLYNLQEDPYEQNNLMNLNLNTEQQIVLEQLQAQAMVIR
tara:strand:+ start:4383 stop:5726 length:1344 start_codon:yes stop_codon:yes gene_type:complete